MTKSKQFFSIIFIRKHLTFINIADYEITYRINLCYLLIINNYYKILNWLIHVLFGVL